jgi:hypothetical protein
VKEREEVGRRDLGEIKEIKAKEQQCELESWSLRLLLLKVSQHKIKLLSRAINHEAKNDRLSNFFHQQFILKYSSLTHSGIQQIGK